MDEDSTQDRAQVGIGTLIVFIAMVVVAAMAATVLVGTAADLQSKAEQVSRESGQQVSNRLMVVSAHGHVTPDELEPARKSNDDVLRNGSVDTVALTVKLSPGAGSVNLSRATIAWVGPQRTTTLVHGRTADGVPGSSDDSGTASTQGLEPAPGNQRGGDSGQRDTHQVFNTYALDGSDHEVLSEQSQRIKIYLNASQIESGSADRVAPWDAKPLAESSTVRLTLTMPSGATTVYELVVPQSTDGDAFVTL